MKTILYIITALMLMSLVIATPLSITDSNYITFDSGLAGPAWQIIVRGDNSADYVLFAPAAQITGTKDGVAVQAKNNFQLSTSIEQELCRYNLYDTAARTDIYKYEVTKEANNQAFWLNSRTIKDCSLKPGYLYGWVYTQWATATAFRDVYCLYQTTLANAGEVSEGQLNFKAKFTLQQTGNPDIIQEINTLASTQGNISNMVNLMQDNTKVAIIKWIGGSTYGEMCPGQDEYVAIQYLNQWQTGNKDRYNEYDIQNKALIDHINYMKNQQKTYYSTSGETQKLQELVTSVNNRASDVLLPEPISTGTNTATIDQSTSILTLPRDHLIYTPDFQIFLSTDYLKLVYLTGRPEITDAIFTTCEEGNNVNAIKVTIQNIGNTQGQFIISDIKCDEGIILGTTIRSITLDPEETGTITLPFSISLASDSSKSCSITVSDSLITANKDSTIINMNCKASTVCSPEGTTRCIPGDNNEYKCTAGQWSITGTKNCANTTCNRNNKCESNLGESFELCGGKTSYNNDCAICNHDNHCDSTETIFSCPADCTTITTKDNTIWYIVGGVAAALAIFFLSEKLGKKKKHKKTKRR